MGLNKTKHLLGELAKFRGYPQGDIDLVIAELETLEIWDEFNDRINKLEKDSAKEEEPEEEETKEEPEEKSEEKEETSEERQQQEERAKEEENLLEKDSAKTEGE